MQNAAAALKKECLDRDGVLAVIVMQLRESVPELGERPISGGDSMAALGADSVERSEVLLYTLEALGIDMPMTQLHGAPSLGALANLLHAKLIRP